MVQPAEATHEELKVCKRQASILRFLRDPVDFFRNLNLHNASITDISLGNRKFYVVSDPAVLRDILATNGNAFEKFPQGNPKQKLFGNGLLTSEGIIHKQQRRLLLPCFHRDRLQEYAQQMVSRVEALTALWRAGSQVVDISRAMNHLTLEIIGCTLLGLEDNRVMGEIGTHLHTMLNLANRFVVPWGDWLMNVPLPSTIRYRRAVSKLDSLAYALIKKARAHSSPQEDLISLLVQSAHPDGSRLTDMEIRDEIVTMIVAGHETVAVGLTWCLNLLSTHAELQEELAARLTAVLGQRQPTADDYPRLDFLQHAFSEALRLHPPIWIMGRRCLEEYAFRDFHASKGSVFLVCIADLHRRPELFPDPDRFLPERWIDPQWPSYAYIPFGGGDRRCVGERFAWMESLFVLASLLRRWRFSPTSHQPPAVAAKLTLHPRHPLNLRIAARA